jgi:hypothetical protein
MSLFIWAIAAFCLLGTLLFFYLVGYNEGRLAGIGEESCRRARQARVDAGYSVIGKDGIEVGLWFPAVFMQASSTHPPPICFVASSSPDQEEAVTCRTST